MSVTYESYLCHHGVKGMKWGVRRSNKPKYRSTSLGAALARRSNNKVDASFDQWKESDKNKSTAIERGKEMNLARMNYEKNPHDKALKREYRSSRKEYKKSLRKNTTYRKGAVKQEVGRDSARKYLSEAKRVKKQLDLDPSNKELKQKYARLMSKHDVDRAHARRALEVSSARSRKKASIKRAMTIGVASLATSAAIGVGVKAVNSYLSGHDVTLNGTPLTLNNDAVKRYANVAKQILGFRKYI